MIPFCALLYLLYRRGIAVSKRIRAVLFLFQPGSSMDRVTVDSCTGWVRHAGRFCEGRSYVFSLDTQLSAGEAEVLVLDGGKRPLLQLDRHTPAAAVKLDGPGGYFLRWTFRHATGKCELRWEPYPTP